MCKEWGTNAKYDPLIHKQKLIEENKFICSECEARLTPIGDFKHHMQTHKLKTNIYICMNCGELYFITIKLKIHILTLIADKPNSGNSPIALHIIAF